MSVQPKSFVSKTPETIKRAAEALALAEMLKAHIQNRGGLSKDETGKPAIPNGAWSMMLDAAATIERLLSDNESLSNSVDRLYLANEQLRWRHPAVIPDWNDLPEPVRSKLCLVANYYCEEHLAGDAAVNFYGGIRKALSAEPDQRPMESLPKGLVRSLGQD